MITVVVLAVVVFEVASSRLILKNLKHGNITHRLEDISPHLVQSIAAGTNMAVNHCQNAFRWERWNCPKSVFNRRVTQSSTKEIAYAKAIIMAGIVHAITKNCSRGDIEGCSCDQKLGIPTSYARLNPNGSPANGDNKVKWKWGGCSDDPRYALDVSKDILYDLERGTDAKAYVARHNAKIGREIVRDTMVKTCRCHGVSGSCSLQTCWMQLASFGDISRRLKDRYRRSVRLTQQVVEKAIFMGNSPRDVLQEKEIREIHHKLVYLDQSPDYCLENVSEGISGTKGRTCSKKSNYASISEKNSCRNLCKKCGYGVKKIKKQVTRRCNCNFVWCCDVACDTCTEMEDEHFCE